MYSNKLVRIPFLIITALLLGACGSSSSSGGGGPDGFVPTADLRSPSVARQWNEVLLDSIRDDFARPTVHARNLWHISAASYDAWAAYDQDASTYLLGRQLDGFACDLDAFVPPQDIHPAREEAISYAVYRLILHRFVNS